jgi:hypothetical protein
MIPTLTAPAAARIPDMASSRLANWTGMRAATALASRMYRLARCAGSRVDPDDWFPATQDMARDRDQAARAIAVCARCPVRPDCLELALRYAFGAGAHSVWGGLVEEDDGRSAAGGWPSLASPNSPRTSPSAYQVHLRGDQQVVLHGGDPGCRGRGCPGRSRLVQ